MDTVLTLWLLDELYWEINHSLHVAYIIINTLAFDLVNRSALWLALKEVSVLDVLLNLVYDLQNSSGARVHTGSWLWSHFYTSPGVRQWCILIPALFCWAVDWILVFATPHVRIKDDHEGFADQDNTNNIPLFVEKSENFSPAHQHLQDTIHNMGLNVSWQKTLVQKFRTGPPEPPSAVSAVKSADEVIYLGCKQSSSSHSKLDILQLLGLAASCIKSVSLVDTRTCLCWSWALCVYQNCVLPVLPQMSETWTLLCSDLEQLEAFHTCCQCQILNIKVV